MSERHLSLQSKINKITVHLAVNYFYLEIGKLK